MAVPARNPPPAAPRSPRRRADRAQLATPQRPPVTLEHLSARIRRSGPASWLRASCRRSAGSATAPGATSTTVGWGSTSPPDQRLGQDRFAGSPNRSRAAWRDTPRTHPDLAPAATVRPGGGDGLVGLACGRGGVANGEPDAAQIVWVLGLDSFRVKGVKPGLGVGGGSLQLLTGTWHQGSPLPQRNRLKDRRSGMAWMATGSPNGSRTTTSSRRPARSAPITSERSSP